MFGFFGKKRAQQANTKFVHKVQEYGNGPKDFIVFSSIDNEKIQKEENCWVSWQVVMSLLENSANLVEYASSLEKFLNTYAEEKAEKIFGGLKK